MDWWLLGRYNPRWWLRTLQCPRLHAISGLLETEPEANLMVVDC